MALYLKLVFRVHLWGQERPLAGEGDSLTALVLAQCLPGGLVAFYALTTLDVFTLYT